MTEAKAAQRAKEGARVELARKEDIFDRVERLYDAIARRAFEIFEGSGGTLGRDLDYWLKAESELLHPVHINLEESDTVLTVRAEAPGFSAKELQVSLESGRLTIIGKRETKEEGEGVKSIYHERCLDQILRVIDLHAEVDPEKTTAILQDGVLTVEMPKAAPAKNVPIETKAA